MKDPTFRLFHYLCSMETKAVFFDVDGTLLSFETHSVPASALQALEALHRKGIKIIIATGRAAADLREINHLPYDAIVALNGAECVPRNGTPIARKPIALDDFLKLKSLAQAYDFPLAIETNNGLFIDKVTPTVIELVQMVEHPIPPVVDIETLFRKESCCQLCIYCNASVEQDVMAQLPGLTASRWHPLFADVNVSGVDKAAGISAYCHHYGFETSQTVAFGDGGNDVAMLQAAGIGVAMGNASDYVKHAADYVTDSVEKDGIQNALLHLGILP